MATRLIRLADGTLVEAEAVPGAPEQIAADSARRVQESLDKIKPILIRTCEPVIAAWTEMNQQMTIEQAEVELGLSFEGEGNIYITKAKAGANLTVKLTLKPPKETDVN